MHLYVMKMREQYALLWADAPEQRELGFQAYELFMRAFSNRTRFAIISELRAGPKSVGELCESLSLEQSLVSHNLKCLLDCGFVTVEREGKNRIYELENETIAPLLGLIDKHVARYRAHLIACKIITPAKREGKSA